MSTGPCLCGDPNCGSCGDGGAAEAFSERLYTAVEAVLDKLGIDADDYDDLADELVMLIERQCDHELGLAYQEHLAAKAEDEALRNEPFRELELEAG
jgi:hypothetical protein